MAEAKDTGMAFDEVEKLIRKALTNKDIEEIKKIEEVYSKEFKIDVLTLSLACVCHPDMIETLSRKMPYWNYDSHNLSTVIRNKNIDNITWLLACGCKFEYTHIIDAILTEDPNILHCVLKFVRDNYQESLETREHENFIAHLAMTRGLAMFKLVHEYGYYIDTNLCYPYAAKDYDQDVVDYYHNIHYCQVHQGREAYYKTLKSQLEEICKRWAFECSERCRGSDMFHVYKPCTYDQYKLFPNCILTKTLNITLVDRKCNYLQWEDRCFKIEQLDNMLKEDPLYHKEIEECHPRFPDFIRELYEWGYCEISITPRI